MTVPRRLAHSSDVPSTLRRALRTERQQTPPAALRAAVWTGIAGTTGLTSATAAGATLASASAAKAATAVTLLSLDGLKWLAVGIGIGSTLIAGTRALTPVINEPAPDVSSESRVAPAPRPGSPRAHGVPPQVVPLSLDVPAARELPAPPGDPVVAAAPSTSAGSAALSPALAARTAAPPPPTQPEPPPSIASLARLEAARVASARSLLRQGDGRATLDALASLDHEVPNGLLVQERKALEVEALSAVGRTVEARRAAEAFSSRYPESPHAARVRSWMARER